MNGLLHRMAARAAGTAVAVRSDAGLAYAGGGVGLGDTGEVDTHFAMAPEPLAQMARASTAHEHEQKTRPADLPVVAVTALTPSPHVTGSNDAGAVRDASLVAPSAGVTPRVDSAPPSAIDEAQLVRPPSQVEPLMPPNPPAGLESGAKATHTPRDVALSSPMMQADEPAPLMPRAARPIPLGPVPQPANRRSALPQGSNATQSEVDTEVHIHIGRIDVTAVHEAAAPRRRATAAPAPMSLDGYLAQRGRT